MRAGSEIGGVALTVSTRDPWPAVSTRHSVTSVCQPLIARSIVSLAVAHPAPGTSSDWAPASAATLATWRKRCSAALTMTKLVIRVSRGRSAEVASNSQTVALPLWALEDRGI